MVSCQAPCNGNAQDPKILVEKSPDFVLRQIFLFPGRGTSCQLTRCVCGFFPAENPRQFTVLAYSCPFLAGDTGAQKKLLSFHLINTRTGENVTGSHRRKTPCGEAVERRLLDARNLFPNPSRSSRSSSSATLPSGSSSRFPENWQSQLESVVATMQ